MVLGSNMRLQTWDESGERLFNCLLLQYIDGFNISSHTDDIGMRREEGRRGSVNKGCCSPEVEGEFPVR